jgi:hypothetical protein
MTEFSKPPLDVLLANLQKGYVGLHIEQGVPILDRDLNLLNDLLMATMRNVFTRYLGNGVASNSQSFVIQAIPAANDFRILAGSPAPGTCLVGGIEVSIGADTNYGGQPGIPPLTTPNPTQPDPRGDMVYLDVSLASVDGTVDADLLNGSDLGIQTSVRQKPAWAVRVAEGAPVPAPAPGHVHYPLARLLRPRGVDTIQAPMLTDLRQTRLNLADLANRLSALEHLLLTPSFAPSPNQFSPKVGGAGQAVTLSGNNFNIGAVQVQFGAVNAAIAGTPTATQIVAQVPAGVTGGVKITVQTAGGSAISNDTFTILPPPPPSFAASPNQFSPKVGGVGLSVTLTGNNFNIGVVQVQFGTVAATIVGAPAAAQITALVPAGVAGNVKIRVTTGGGTILSDDSFIVI